MTERVEVNCPACNELILLSAKKCKHCGEWLVPKFHKTKRIRWRMFVGYGAICLTAILGYFIYSLSPHTYPNADFGLRANAADSFFVVSNEQILVDSFSFDVRAQFEHVSPRLQRGALYRIRLSGRAGVGPLDGGNVNNAMPDAAFSYCRLTNYSFDNLDLCHIPASPSNWVSAWDSTAGRRPSPDIYSANHEYDYYIRGEGEPLVWTFQDNPYWDNNGDFRVQIYHIGKIRGRLLKLLLK